MKEKLREAWWFALFFVLPLVVVAFVVLTAITLYWNLDDELGSLWLNMACLFGVVEAIGIIIELTIMSLAQRRRSRKGKRLPKHAERNGDGDQLR